MPSLPITLLGAREIKNRQQSRTEDSDVPLPDNDAAACTGTGQNFVIAGRTQYTTRPKTAAPLREALASAAEAADARGITVMLPSFDTYQTREYDTQEAVLEDFKEYCAMHNVAFRVRQSKTREARNKFLEDRAKQATETPLDDSPSASTAETPLDDSPSASETPLEETVDASLVLLPESMTHSMRQYQCVHAGKQKTRSTGQRVHALTRFTNCGARMTANAVYNPFAKKWSVVLDNENTTHNHVCNESVFYSYLNHSKIDDDALFNEVASAIASDGNARIIRDNITAKSGAPFTQAQYSNLKHYKLGNVQAGENLEYLIKKFGELSGNWCTVLREEGTEMVRGIVFQTALQRAQFQRFGGSLVLDWTHSTNNLGFHLGSLLATSATGKGVPVLEFLCLSQGTVTMRSVLEAFVAHNPGAVNKVKSFVIDKDLAEWAAIRAVFPKSAVVLCQFHVVKWFKGCMTNRDYHIEPEDQKPTLKILRAMVYATSAATFKGLKGQLRRRLNKEKHAPFHAYMKRRWYSMSEQWWDYRRGKVFTADNTTSNRLESHWKHLKAGMGKKRRIDACFQGIVQRARSVLSRERDELVKYQGTTRLLGGVNEFVHPLLRELSASRVLLVRKQWEKYAAHPSWFHARSVEASAEGSAVYSVSVKPQSFVEHTVSCCATAQWSCSCRFAVTHRLPCRHQLYVGQKHLNLAAFPVSALASRWRMSDATTLIDDHNKALKELATVRVPVPGFTLPESRPDGTTESKTPQTARPQAVTHVRVRSSERTDALVVDAISKRNHVRGQLAQVVLPMMELSSLRFRSFSEKLEDLLVAFVESLAVAPTEKQAAPRSEINTADGSMQTSDVVPGSTGSTDGKATWGVDVGGSLDPEQLHCLLNDGEFVEPTDGEDGAARREPVEEHEDEDEQADEEDFFEEEVLEPTQVQDSILDLGDLLAGTALDAATTSLSPRFPGLGESQSASELDALMNLDSDGEDGYCSTADVGSGYVEAVAAAIAASSHGLFGPSVLEQPKILQHGPAPIPIPRSLITEEVVSSEHTMESAATTYSAQAKRKAEELSADIEPTKKARGDHGLLISKYLPSATRGATRQKAQLGPSGDRIAAIVTRSECPLVVSDFVRVLRSSPLAEFDDLVQLYPVLYTDTLFNARAVRVDRAAGTMPTLNFLVPSLVEDKLRAAVNDAKSSAGTPLLLEANSIPGIKGSNGSSASAPLLVEQGLGGKDNGESAEAQFCAKVQGMAQAINENGLLALAAATSLKRLHARYRDDCDWILNDWMWNKASFADPLPFLDDYAAECGAGPSTKDPLGVSEMRETVLATLKSYCLGTTLTVPVLRPLAGDVPARRSPSVLLHEVFGRLRGNEWLNDTTMNFALQLLASNYSDVSVIDSLMAEKPPAPPAAFITLQRLVVFPINFDNAHWLSSA